MTVPFSLTVTFLVKGAPTGRDTYGNDTFTPTNLPVENCMYAPGGSIEQIAGQDRVIDQPTVYAPAAAAVVSALDQATVPGYGTFEVDGDPQVWPPHPRTGWLPSNNVVVRLLKVSG